VRNVSIKLYRMLHKYHVIHSVRYYPREVLESISRGWGGTTVLEIGGERNTHGVNINGYRGLNERDHLEDLRVDGSISTELHRAQSFLKTKQFLAKSRNSPYFMGPKTSSTRPQELATCP
jgi:hypothetical protein